jgi:DNA-binding NarL/FixJ family response regulator
MTRVVVVDDHPLVRRGLVEVLRDDPTITVCGEVGTIADFMATVSSNPPDVAIIDLSLGDESGLDLISVLTQQHPNVRVLVLSGHDERIHADRALRAGALGYIMKDKAAADLIAAVHQVAAGKASLSPETTDRLLATLTRSERHAVRSPLDRLSNRERQVLTLTGQGFATRAIAKELGLSVKTVESHRAHIKDKLGLHNSRELMRVAVMWAETEHV